MYLCYVNNCFFFFFFFFFFSYNTSLGRIFGLNGRSLNTSILEWDLCLLWSYFLVIIKRFREIILPYATWKTFIEKCLDIEQVLQSTAPSSLVIRNLIVELVKIHERKYSKIEITRCLFEHEIVYIQIRTLYESYLYFKLCQKTHCTKKNLNSL